MVTVTQTGFHTSTGISLYNGLSLARHIWFPRSKISRLFSVWFLGSLHKNSKRSLCPGHEGIQEKKMYSSIHFLVKVTLRLLLSLGNWPFYTLNWRLGGPRAGLGTVEERKMSYPCRKSARDISVLHSPIIRQQENLPCPAPPIPTYRTLLYKSGMLVILFV
jgi:hypothetical protein